MITHIVLFKIRPDVPEEQIERVFSELASLKNKIPGVLSFHGGPYSSNEGLNRAYTHAFTMTFPGTLARDEYLPHPDHELAKGHVLEILEGGLDGVLAFDFES